MRLNRRDILRVAATTGTLPLAAGELAPAFGASPAPQTTEVLRPASPVLVVHDLELMSRYYREAMGFHLLDKEKSVVRLGAGGRLLLTLQHVADATLEPRGFAGLFHTAFLMPSRLDLARWLTPAARSGALFVGASDHLVSEALYLEDPEGNGIEVYADRPHESWVWTNGTVKMDTIDLDLQSLIALAGADVPEVPSMPDGLRVGHIHLRVGGIAEAEAFYADVLGLDVTNRVTGATFYSTGRYHHHLATNTWQSLGSPKRSGSITGLSSFDMIAHDQAAYEGAAEQLLRKGAKREGDLIWIADPWSNRINLLKG